MGSILSIYKIELVNGCISGLFILVIVAVAKEFAPDNVSEV
jgi:hypothetical protein